MSSGKREQQVNMESLFSRKRGSDHGGSDDRGSPPVKRGRPTNSAKTCEVRRLKTGKGAASCTCFVTYNAGDFKLFPLKGKGKGKSKDKPSEEQQFEEFRATYLADPGSAMVGNMRLATAVRQGGAAPLHPSDVSNGACSGHRCYQTLLGYPTSMFKEKFGHEPKDLGFTISSLTNQYGKAYQGVLMADEQSPVRYEVYTDQSSRLCDYKMVAANQLWAGQEELVYGRLTQEQGKQGMLQKLRQLGGNPVAVYILTSV